MSNESGDVLLSHTLAHAVPSGLRSLTAVFGMGTGVTFSLVSPKIFEVSEFDGALDCPLAGRLVGRFASGRARYFTAIQAAQRMPRVNFMVKPNGLLVTVSSVYYYTYTSVLSTW